MVTELQSKQKNFSRFFSATGAKNMTKPNNGVVWKQWPREKVLGLNLNKNQFTLITRTVMMLSQVQTAQSLFISISGGPWFLQLWSWSWKQQWYQKKENQNDTQVAWRKKSFLSKTEKRNGKRRKSKFFWEPQKSFPPSSHSQGFKTSNTF